VSSVVYCGAGPPCGGLSQAVAFSPLLFMGIPLGVRVHLSVVPSPAELDEARSQLTRGSCPRRYCWYWHTLAFDWSLSPGEGCEVAERHIVRSLLEHDKGQPLLSWQQCSRASNNPQHPDYYEPREPHLDDDGWPADFFAVVGKAARVRRYERLHRGQRRKA
jgi:hypothetical protein